MPARPATARPLVSPVIHAASRHKPGDDHGVESRERERAGAAWRQRPAPPAPPRRICFWKTLTATIKRNADIIIRKDTPFDKSRFSRIRHIRPAETYIARFAAAKNKVKP